MNDIVEFQNKSTITNLIQYLDVEDRETILSIKEELFNNWKKKQIFRTDTEMRVSVLNDAKYPTQASKYWQSVREMSAMFDALMHLTFEIRRNEVERLRVEKRLKELNSSENPDELELIDLQIDLDQNNFNRVVMLQVAHDRVRELKNWSKIKAELDDGSFDVENVNTHQAESLHHYFSNRVNSLNSSAAPGEIINAVGPFQSLSRMKKPDGTVASFDEIIKHLK